MTSEMNAGVAAAIGSGVSVSLVGLPNPISAALYALIAAVVGWVTSFLLNLVKKKLGL